MDLAVAGSNPVDHPILLQGQPYWLLDHGLHFIPRLTLTGSETKPSGIVSLTYALDNP